MIVKENKFGTGAIYQGDALVGPVYLHCVACMTIHTETLGWAAKNKHKIIDIPEHASEIVVLSCQVTDLAILNDINSAEAFASLYPQATIYIGGCLAQRFDIELPKNVRRLEHLRSDYTPANNDSLVTYAAPFWDRKENLFRDHYPLRVGVGCHGKCQYCTIRTTRGPAYQLDIEKLESDFASAPEGKTILPIADSMQPKQIWAIASLARQYKRKISLRNVEPQNVMEVSEVLFSLASAGLLDTLHTPVQAFDESVLQLMSRNVTGTKQALKVCQQLKTMGVKLATNIIIDYPGVEQAPDAFDPVYALFDHVAWNPYWNGHWNRDEAKKRWAKYLF